MQDYEDILLVDDSDVDVTLITRGLKKYGNITNEVIPFYNAESFLDYLELVPLGKKPFPAIVLLDINLPAMSGHAALRNMRARKAFKKIPTVAMVSHSKAQEDIDQAMDNGANGYFVKPAQKQEWVAFCDYVQEMLEEAKKIAESKAEDTDEFLIFNPDPEF